MRQRAVFEAICGFAILVSCASPGYAAEDRCRELLFRERVDVAGGGLTLEDLLAETCPRLRAMAGHVSLGQAPRLGSVRALAGEEIRARVAALVRRDELPEGLVVDVPRRILVERRASVKSCAEVARSIVRRPSDPLPGGIADGDFGCATAGVPRAASLEVTKTAWDPLLERWQFALRCRNTEDCLPFLVWASSSRLSSDAFGTVSAAKVRSTGWVSGAVAPKGRDLIKPGQRALLRWEQAGIRVVLPVICLKGGAAGEQVRVRLESSGEIMRAEILGDGTLWVTSRAADRE